MEKALKSRLVNQLIDSEVQVLEYPTKSGLNLKNLLYPVVWW